MQGVLDNTAPALQTVTGQLRTVTVPWPQLWKGYVLTESPQPIQIKSWNQVLNSKLAKQKSSQQKVHQNNCNQFLTVLVVELLGTESLDHGQCLGSPVCIHGSVSTVCTSIRPQPKTWTLHSSQTIYLISNQGHHQHQQIPPWAL